MEVPSSPPAVTDSCQQPLRRIDFAAYLAAMAGGAVVVLDRVDELVQWRHCRGHPSKPNQALILDRPASMPKQLALPPSGAVRLEDQVLELCSVGPVCKILPSGSSACSHASTGTQALAKQMRLNCLQAVNASAKQMCVHQIMDDASLSAIPLEFICKRGCLSPASVAADMVNSTRGMCCTFPRCGLSAVDRVPSKAASTDARSALLQTGLKEFMAKAKDVRNFGTSNSTWLDHEVCTIPTSLPSCWSLILLGASRSYSSKGVMQTAALQLKAATLSHLSASLAMNKHRSAFNASGHGALRSFAGRKKEGMGQISWMTSRTIPVRSEALRPVLKTFAQIIGKRHRPRRIRRPGAGELPG